MLVICVYIHTICTTILFSPSPLPHSPAIRWLFLCTLFFEDSHPCFLSANYHFPKFIPSKLSFTNIHANLTRRCRKTVPAMPNLLLHFSASHLCFPVRSPFPWTASHATFFYRAVIQALRDAPWNRPAISTPSSVLFRISSVLSCPITVSLHRFSRDFLFRQPYKPCSMLPRNRTCHINPLLLFSASHPCFPVRLPFPGTASHETLFS